MGGPGMLILEEGWGGVLAHYLPTSTRSSDCFPPEALSGIPEGMEESTDFLPPQGEPGWL